MKRILSLFRKESPWVHAKEFKEYGFIEINNSRFEKGDIVIQLIDHWHVFKKSGKPDDFFTDIGEDLGRFYTDRALRDRVKKHFGIKLKK